MPVTPEVAKCVQDIKNDATATNWATFGLDGKTIKTLAKGCNGREELLKHFTSSAVLYALLRTVTGDRESRRIKFVLITWVGHGASVLAKGRATTLKSELLPSVGQYHIEITTDDLLDVSEESLNKRLKVAGGADYDTGSNAGGSYKGEGPRSMKAKAMDCFSHKQGEGSPGANRAATAASPKAKPVAAKGRTAMSPVAQKKEEVADKAKATAKASASVNVGAKDKPHDQPAAHVTAKDRARAYENAQGKANVKDKANGKADAAAKGKADINDTAKDKSKAQVHGKGSGKAEDKVDECAKEEAKVGYNVCGRETAEDKAKDYANDVEQADDNVDSTVDSTAIDNPPGMAHAPPKDNSSDNCWPPHTETDAVPIPEQDERVAPMA